MKRNVMWKRAISIALLGSLPINYAFAGPGGNKGLNNSSQADSSGQVVNNQTTSQGSNSLRQEFPLLPFSFSECDRIINVFDTEQVLQPASTSVFFNENNIISSSDTNQTLSTVSTSNIEGKVKRRADKNDKIGLIKKRYGEGQEAEKIRNKTRNFDAYNSPAYILLTSEFGSCLRLQELIGIYSTARAQLSLKGIMIPKVGRDQKRSFSLMIKLFDDNLDKIRGILSFITLWDEKGNNIILDYK